VCTLLLSFDPALTHQALKFAAILNHPTVSAKAVQQLGIIQTTDPEGLDFIQIQLNSPDHSSMREAIVAVSRMAFSRRSMFFPRLNELAADPKQSDDVKRQLTQALKNDGR
jgi:hypothetical protein